MNKNGKQGIGKLGEDLACQFLKKKGYLVLARNYRRPWGEIDVVTRAPDGTLVFVEVKTMKTHGEGAEDSLVPEDNVSRSKLEKLRRTCRAFCGDNPEKVKEKKGWRIDLLAISLYDGAGDLTVNGKDCKIHHYEGI